MMDILNGDRCCVSLNYLITELSSCKYVAPPPDKMIIHVESDIELNSTLFITNFCNIISKEFELIGSDMYPTISCHGFGMGFHFHDVQDLHLAHLKFSKCGFHNDFRFSQV